MANTEKIQEKVTKLMTNEARVELKTVAEKQGVVIDPGEVTKVVTSKTDTAITVPSTMNKLQVAFNIIKQAEEEETYRTYQRKYENVFINDFFVTLQILIPKYFGMLHVSPFNTDGKPAGQDYIQFPIGFDKDGKTKNEKAYIGSIIAPCWENCIIDINPPGFIAVRAKMKFEEQVNNFLTDVQNSILTNSVIKGNSIKIDAVRGGLIATPIFVKTNDKIVLADDVNRVVDNLVIPGLKKSRKNCILFTGDFGNGKTETALKIGKTARENYGRTFIYLSNSGLFKQVVPYINNYAPAIIFAEDIDQISDGDRNSDMNDLLNELDGNELKNSDCTFIFTTNNHDKIHPAMRRPGRIDQVVHFDYCTKESIAKIFALYAKDIEGWESVDYVRAAENCPPNLQGAVVAEIAKRAVDYSVELHNGVISTDRFLDSIASMKYHIEFMKNEQKKDHSAENLLGHLLFKGMQKAFPSFANPDGFGEDSPYQNLNG